MAATRRSRQPLAGLLAAAGAAAAVALAIPTLGAAIPRAPATATCVGDTGPAALTALFDREPGGMMAADYQRALALPDGRTLWLFQDATVRLPPPAAPTTTTTVPGQPPPPPPPTERLLHNVALVQTGTCFELLRSGSAADPGPWLFAAQTVPFGHWFWPLGATVGSDGRVYVFVAEMREYGPLYLSSTVPLSTRVVALDPVTLAVDWVGHPWNAGPQLYGFSIASDDDWTYLYAQCHRQFGWDMILPGAYAHDLACSADVTVARVPAGRVLDRPQYWDGNTWSLDAAAAVPVFPTDGRRINPAQVRRDGDGFVAVTKEGDWFGTTIHLERAPNAEGPWTTYARVPAMPKCAREICNTYFASWVPGVGPTGGHVIGLSHNRWDGRLSTINRPTFFEVPAPGAAALAYRCAVVDC